MIRCFCVVCGNEISDSEAFDRMPICSESCAGGLADMVVESKFIPVMFEANS